jgi:branched-subunit amino acid transport protein
MSTLLIVLGMSLATMVPRLLPALVMERLVIPDWLDKWLKNIPYAALGALIFPGVLSIDEQPEIGLIGGGVAAVMAYFRLHTMVVIIGSIVAVMAAKAVM